LLVVWVLAGRWYESRLLSQARAEAAVESSLRANALSSATNRRLARLQGLYAFVQVELSEQDFATQFDKFASGLYAGTRGIRSLSVAPEGIIRYVYPRTGNLAAVGYEPLRDPRPQVRAEAERAVEEGELALIGPDELIQGGWGLTARSPVYQDSHFWGFVNMALDMGVMLEEAGFDNQPGTLNFALRDDNGLVFYGSPEVFGQSPVIAMIELPGEVWELAAAPPEGWQATIQGPLMVSRIAGLTIALLLAGLVYLSINRQARLVQAVRQRTRQIARVNEQLEQDIAERRRAETALSEREAQYRSIFESTSDALLVYDLQGNLVDLNPAAAAMHGYTATEFQSLQPAQFIYCDSWPLFEEFLETVGAGEEFERRAVHVRKDGTPFHVEVLGTVFAYRGEPHALAVVRDITEEVEAFQLLEQRVEERTRDLATLLDVSAHIAATLELDPLLDLTLVQVQKAVDYDGADVLLLEDGELRNAAHRGTHTAGDLSDLGPAGDLTGDLWQAMAGRKPVIIGDIWSETWLAQAFRQAAGLHPEWELKHHAGGTQQASTQPAGARSWLGIPLTVQERLTGWLILYHHERDAYTEHHAALVQAIANQAATAIENARLYAQARRLAALEERQRLARELHDSVSQALYGIGLGARTARTLLDRDPAQAVEPIDYVLSLADASLAEMRALIFELRPDSLQREGLVAALSRLATSLRARYELEVNTALSAEPALDEEAKEALYRIAQEALNNIARHAEAKRVDISLKEIEGEVLLEVRDDGVGFEPEAEYPGHMGLSSMRERAVRLGGRLELESAPGQGTRLRAHLPSGTTP
jgi:PAS domain S-box-containing protein